MWTALFKLFVLSGSGRLICHYCHFISDSFVHNATTWKPAFFFLKTLQTVKKITRLESNDDQQFQPKNVMIFFFVSSAYALSFIGGKANPHSWCKSCYFLLTSGFPTSPSKYSNTPTHTHTHACTSAVAPACLAQPHPFFSPCCPVEWC